MGKVADRCAANASINFDLDILYRADGNDTFNEGVGCNLLVGGYGGDTYKFVLDFDLSIDGSTVNFLRCRNIMQRVKADVLW